MPRRLSAKTIRARIEYLEKQAHLLERDAVKGLKAAAAVVAKYGLSLTDLREAFDMSKGRAKRGSSLAGRTVPIKYRDAQGNTWTGRGRAPLWLVAAEKAGKKRESFLVAANNRNATEKKQKPVRAKKGAKSAKMKDKPHPVNGAAASE